MNVDMKALASLTIEKEIPLDRLILAIEAAVLTAYVHMPEARPHAFAHLDRESGEIHIKVPIFGEDGEKIEEEIDNPAGFSRIATSTARQLINSE